jgi:hypothetical protein
MFSAYAAAVRRRIHSRIGFEESDCRIERPAMVNVASLSRLANTALVSRHNYSSKEGALRSIVLLVRVAVADGVDDDCRVAQWSPLPSSVSVDGIDANERHCHKPVTVGNQ